MKNRILRHQTIKAGDLVPHELNPRVHNDEQREALQALFGEIGFARSLLAYETSDGRLKLIDGHLRQSELDPDEEITVEVLDVTDEEARKLLLSIDPLAALADFDDKALDALRETVASDSDTLNALWSSLQKQDNAAMADMKKKAARRKVEQLVPEQFMVVVECESETEQVALLRRFKKEGLQCHARTS